jgi:hypothetical protein
MSQGEHPPLPSGSRIVVTECGPDLTLEIPPRGLIRGSFGLVFFAAFWLTITAAVSGAMVLAENGIRVQPLPFAVGMTAFISIFWLIGLGVLAFAIHTGRRRVTISTLGDRLSILQSGGIVGPKQQEWARDQLSVIRVGPSTITVNNRPLDELQVVSTAEKKFGLLAGWPRPELDWLATRLTSRFELPSPEEQKLVLTDVDRPPTATQVVYQPVDDGFTLSIPPAGLGRGSMALFPIGLVWSIWVVLFSMAFPFFGPAWPIVIIPWLMLLGNLLIGIGIMLVGYYLGKRQAEIAVAGGRMLVLHQGFIAGNWKREWSRDELAAVRAGDSTTKVNNQPLAQLQIVPRSGPTVTLLTGRKREELAWIATLIRHGLDVPADPQLVASAIPTG